MWKLKDDDMVVINSKSGEIMIYTQEEFEAIEKELKDRLPKDGTHAFNGEYFIFSVMDAIEGGIM